MYFCHFCELYTLYNPLGNPFFFIGCQSSSHSSYSNSQSYFDNYKNIRGKKFSSNQQKFSSGTTTYSSSNDTSFSLNEHHIVQAPQPINTQQYNEDVSVFGDFQPSQPPPNRPQKRTTVQPQSLDEKRDYGLDEVIDSPAMHKATMRKYQINGKWYYPTTTQIGKMYVGIASWYGPKFHGKKTSNGEVYDMHKFTSAHKTLPMNTMVKVTNLSNQKAITVRINDRGPFVKDRIIDLSFAAAKALDVYEHGTTKVQLEILGFNARIDDGTSPTSFPQIVRIQDIQLQVGAFSTYEKSQLLLGRFTSQRYQPKVVKMQSHQTGKVLYKAILTGFKSEEEAEDFKINNNLNDAFISGN